MSAFEALLSRATPVLLDGGMGTALRERGLGNEPAASWCRSQPDEVAAVHRHHALAGAEVVLTNTFGAQIPSAEECAAALQLARASGAGLVAASLFADLGPEEIDKAVRALAGADVIWLETGMRVERAASAVAAARAAAGLPVVATFAFAALGAGPSAATARPALRLLLELARAGAAAVGLNCSPWPREPGALASLATELSRALPVPLVLKPDAVGIAPARWAEEVAGAVRAGARLVGGCCGTTHAHLAALAARIR